jgi:predicted nucleotide-binding protein
MSRSEAEERINRRIEMGRELRARRFSSPQKFQVANGERAKWEEYNADMLASMFTNTSISEEYSHWYIAAPGPKPFAEAVQEYYEELTDKIGRLESIRDRLELYAEPTEIKKPPRIDTVATSTRRVFVVHGRDEAAKQAVARMLEKLELKPTILHEQAGRGQTIIEKFEAHADVAFAVVLLTPDDAGYPRDEPDKAQPRARQNVVLELGYFLGLLGRNRVCALKRDEVELPSDYLGVEYVSMDGAGAWRYMLADEIKAAGIDVDLNKLGRG